MAIRNQRLLTNLRLTLPDSNEMQALNGTSTDTEKDTEIQSLLSDEDKDEFTESERQPEKRTLVQRKSEGRLAAIISDVALSQSLVQLLRDPTVFNFSRLRKKLRSDDRRWMSGFLKLGGLEMLFEGLRSFGSYSGTFSNLVQRLECVMCIKTVMNSQIGLQSLTTSRKFGSKFGAGKPFNFV